jgi:hypothetical protein
MRIPSESHHTKPGAMAIPWHERFNFVLITGNFCRVPTKKAENLYDLSRKIFGGTQVKKAPTLQKIPIDGN